MAFIHSKYFLLSLLFVASFNTQLHAECIDGNRIEQGTGLHIEGDCVTPPTLPYPDKFKCYTGKKLTQGTADTCILGEQADDPGLWLPSTECPPGKRCLQGTEGCTIDIPNSAPVAVADTHTVNEDATTSPIDVLANDSDAEGHTIFIENLTTPNHGGTAVINGSKVDYTPATGFTGTEIFNYTVTDSVAVGNTVSVTVTVNPVYDFIRTALTPNDGNTSVDANTDLSVRYEDYDTAISKVSGKTFRIYKADGTEHTNFDASAIQVSVSGNTVTVNPNSHLVYGVAHYVQIDTGAFEDESSNTNQGINDETTWNFSVPSSSGPCGCDAFDNCDLPIELQ